MEFRNAWHRGNCRIREHVAAVHGINALLQLVPDSAREGLAETPQRFVRAFEEMTSGYRTDVDSLFKTFGDGAEGYDEMVVLRDVPFHSLCEHHIAPFFGTATIGYIPDGRVVGLSKLARVLEAYARRLQIQERLTTQVREAVERNLQPKGVGVVIRARHFCMECRGVKKVGVETVTSALSGLLRTDAAARAEFLGLSR